MQSKTPDHKNQERLTKQHYAKKKNQSSKREMKIRYLEIGNVEMWKCGNVEMWKCGNVEINQCTGSTNQEKANK